MSLSDTLAVLARHGLLDRATVVTVGDVHVEMVSATPAPEVLTEHELRQRLQEAQREQAELDERIMFAAS